MVLHFSNGETIETTAEHPFFVKDKGWVPAGQLAIGNAIVTRAGPSVSIRKIVRHSAGKTVYNFEVEDTHTYFVGKTDGGLWVHNDCLDIAYDEWIKQGEGSILRISPKPGKGRYIGEELWENHDVFLDMNGNVFDPMRFKNGRIPSERIPLDDWFLSFDYNEVLEVRYLDWGEIQASVRVGRW